MKQRLEMAAHRATSQMKRVITSCLFLFLDSVCRTPGNPIALHSSNQGDPSDVTHGVDEMVTLPSSGINETCTCRQILHKSLISETTENFNYEFNLAKVLNKSIETSATLKVGEDYEPSATFHFNNNHELSATFNFNNDHGPITTLIVTTDQEPSVTSNVNYDREPSATLKFVNDYELNATRIINNGPEINTTLNDMTKWFMEMFNITTNSISRQSQGSDNSFHSAVNGRDRASSRPNRSTASSTALDSNLSAIVNSAKQEPETKEPERGNNSLLINPETVELECFGCNGELMPDNFHKQGDSTPMMDGFRTASSLTPSVFRLVQGTDRTLTDWTRSHCELNSPLCNDCNKLYWFVRRPDDACRRLYIYYHAMSVDDMSLSIDFDDLNKMSHFIISFLKRKIGSDVLEEWWPPTLVFDGRLKAYLCVARFLVYDVHRASVRDAVNQIRHVSLMMNTLRRRCKQLFLEAHCKRNIKYTLGYSFDLGGQMREALEFYNLTAQTNRSACVCKAVLGAVLTLKIIDDINDNCRLGCFSETFYEYEFNLESNLEAPCFEMANSVLANNDGSPFRLRWFVYILIRNCACVLIVVSVNNFINQN